MTRSVKAVSVPTFSTLMELEIGQRSVKELLDDLEAAKVFVDPTAVTIVKASTIPALQPERVRFGVATVRELGYRRESTWSSVISCMRQLGLSLCGVLDALEVSLAYHDQSRLKELFVAMEPARNYAGVDHILAIGKGWMSERNLCSQVIRSDTLCELEAKLVFRLPTKHL